MMQAFVVIVVMPEKFHGTDYYRHVVQGFAKHRFVLHIAANACKRLL